MARPKRAPIEAVKPDAKPERFIRLVNLGRGDGYITAFQPEYVEILNGKVIKRERFYKPDTFGLAYAQAIELLSEKDETIESERY